MNSYIFHIHTNALPEVRVTAHKVENRSIVVDSEIEVGTLVIPQNGNGRKAFQSQLADMLTQVAGLGFVASERLRGSMYEDDFPF